MSGAKLFGTDGVRGEANVGLTAPLALKLGMAAGHWVLRHARLEGASTPEMRRPRVILGRDTRLSGDMLEAALSAGLASMGVDALNIDVVPTPAVSQVVRALSADAGVVISASHNPFPDNGIKFFGPDGKKLPDEVEREIEASVAIAESLPRPTGGAIGRVLESREPVEEYVRRVIASVGAQTPKPLAGLKLVMDCANGAAHEIGPRTFRELGAEVLVIHDYPDGVNINEECGSTRPACMAKHVRETGADAGLAFDGDADRVILADANGEIVDGDRMMAIIALHLQSLGRLNNGVVVATIMSNVGLEQALASHDIRLHRTKVGDKYVAQAMEELEAAVGGEKSGHILLPFLTPTGDGLVTALQTLTVMREQNRSLSELASVMQEYPQLLVSLKVLSMQGWDSDPDIAAAIRAGEAMLGKAEWLSVRPSGTEPLLRVMAQGTDGDVVNSVVHNICTVVKRKMGEGKP